MGNSVVSTGERTITTATGSKDRRSAHVSVKIAPIVKVDDEPDLYRVDYRNVKLSVAKLAWNEGEGFMQVVFQSNTGRSTFQFVDINRLFEMLKYVSTDLCMTEHVERVPDLFNPDNFFQDSLMYIGVAEPSAKPSASQTLGDPFTIMKMHGSVVASVRDLQGTPCIVYRLYHPQTFVPECEMCLAFENTVADEALRTRALKSFLAATGSLGRIESDPTPTPRVGPSAGAGAGAGAGAASGVVDDVTKEKLRLASLIFGERYKELDMHWPNRAKATFKEKLDVLAERPKTWVSLYPCIELAFLDDFEWIPPMVVTQVEVWQRFGATPDTGVRVLFIPQKYLFGHTRPAQVYPLDKHNDDLFSWGYCREPEPDIVFTSNWTYIRPQLLLHSPASTVTPPPPPPPPAPPSLP